MATSKMMSKVLRFSQPMLVVRPQVQLTSTTPKLSRAHTSAAWLSRNLSDTLENEREERFKNHTRGLQGAGLNLPLPRFTDFDLHGSVKTVTGGAQGLGLFCCGGMVQSGGHVYLLDYQKDPPQDFLDTPKLLAKHFGSTLHYFQVDVRDEPQLDEVIGGIAKTHGRIDGLLANAGVQFKSTALDFSEEQMNRVMDINFFGVLKTARVTAKHMIGTKTPGGKMVLLASMSGITANKGLMSSVYNASKAAVTQVTRNLAMEWARAIEMPDGTRHPIRVNSVSPGNILTPMVEKDFADQPGLKEELEAANMLGRIAKPEEFRGAVVFLLSDASSFMTGSNMVIDGGYTAW